MLLQDALFYVIWRFYGPIPRDQVEWYGPIPRDQFELFFDDPLGHGEGPRMPNIAKNLMS